MERKPLSVTELNNQIKQIVEKNIISKVLVTGEISGYSLKTHAYFDLKDANSGADSKIKCAIWSSTLRNVKMKIENGLNVIIDGYLSVYVPNGTYSVIVNSIQPDGIGALALAYEQLKDKLSKKGYFDFHRKKPLPRFPKRIALITSSSGAVIHDMLNVANKRWRDLNLTLIDSAVQGKNAEISLANSIKLADSFYGSKNAFDIIVIARGGGSMEDLWCFNEEILADAIFNAKTPIVSAVGHDSDYSICDFVSDLRAPTPSAAMEMILPDRIEWLQKVGDMIGELENRFLNIIESKSRDADILYNDMDQILDRQFYTLDKILQEYQERLNELDFATQTIHKEELLREIKDSLDMSISYIISNQNKEIENLKNTLQYNVDVAIKDKETSLNMLSVELNALNPQRLIQNGYAQITKDNKILSLSEIETSDEFTLTDINKSINVVAK